MISNRTARSGGRRAAGVAATVVLAVGALLTLAGPASAETAADPGKPLGFTMTVAIFVGIPLAAFALIALLVTAPRLVRGSRTEDDLGWYRDATADRSVGDRDSDVAQVEAAPASPRSAISER